jgi:hypothetical protein
MLPMRSVRASEPLTSVTVTVPLLVSVTFRAAHCSAVSLLASHKTSTPIKRGTKTSQISSRRRIRT